MIRHTSIHRKLDSTELSVLSGKTGKFQSALMSDIHQHYFTGALPTFSVGAGETLFAYIDFDLASPPGEGVLEWFGRPGWEHRAYWGAKFIPCGLSDAGRHCVGPLPAAGQWVQLAVPASQVGFAGISLSGMAFALYSGSAMWDYSVLQ